MRPPHKACKLRNEVPPIDGHRHAGDETGLIAKAARPPREESLQVDPFRFIGLAVLPADHLVGERPESKNTTGISGSTWRARSRTTRVSLPPESATYPSCRARCASI